MKKRPALAAALLLACLVGGCVAAVVVTSPGAIGAVFTTTATTGTEPITTTMTTATTTTPAPQRIAAGVTIGGVRVGGMTAADAYTAVRTAFERPLVLLLGKHRLQVSPERLGALADALDA